MCVRARIVFTIESSLLLLLCIWLNACVGLKRLENNSRKGQANAIKLGEMEWPILVKCGKNVEGKKGNEKKNGTSEKQNKRKKAKQCKKICPASK